MTHLQQFSLHPTPVCIPTAPPRTIRKVAVVVGTRPEAIKLAPVILALRKACDFDCKVCLTGQHRQMLDQALDVFGITADADLDLMTPNQTLGAFTARALVVLDAYLAAERPALVLLQGDTTTAFCAALAAFYQRVPVAHVEAGLRTWNLDAPWPEEANRVLTTRLTALHLAPTVLSRDNLLRENVPAAAIVVTGNPVVDALRLAVARVEQEPPLLAGLPPEVLAAGTTMVLITGHRRESFGEGFRNICAAIAELAARFPAVHFVYPVHLNPRVREPVFGILGATASRNVHLIDPISYLPFVRLMRSARIILSDSGGIQEEAPSLGVPVLVMRDTTERPEGLACGAVKLVGTRTDTVVAEATRLLTDAAAYASMVCSENPYGDGRAAERICEACRRYLDEREVQIGQ